MSYDTVPVSPTPIHEHARQWRLGYQAGLRERRLLVVAAVIGLVVLCKRHLNPWAALVVGLGLAVVLTPVLLVLLAVEVTRRQHVRWRSWQRTVLMAASWLAGFGVGYLDLRFHLGPALLAVVPVVVLAWTVDRFLRRRRERGELASVPRIDS